MKRPSAVDRERRAGDERGFRAGEEQDGLRDLQRIRDALERLRRHVARAVRHHRRVHHAGTYAVDADHGRQFGGQRARQSDDAGVVAIGCPLATSGD
jgi:hypothetical protein